MKAAFRIGLVGTALGPRVAFMVLAALSATGLARAQSDKLPTGGRILEKSIEGQGGREAFEKLRSRVSKGTIEMARSGQPVKGTITLYEQAPDKRYLLVELPPAGRIEAGSDGEVHWELSPGGATIQEGEERLVAQRQNRFNSLLHWREYYEKVECVGKETVDDRSCYKVVLTPTAGPPVTMYFDRKNGLPIKTQTVRKIQTGEVPVETRLEDYREVDGVRLPFKTVRRFGIGAQLQTTTTTWESIEHNVDIPADRFVLPDKVKELAEQKGQAKPEDSGGGGQ
jgi:outer membrane lipoprotein-sorting protein